MQGLRKQQNLIKATLLYSIVEEKIQKIYRPYNIRTVLKNDPILPQSKIKYALEENS